MTVKKAGGRITGHVALTCEQPSGTPLVIGEPVHLTGTYEVELADGSQPVIGVVSVAAKKYSGGSLVGAVPGDVTVEARGVAVWTLKSTGAVAAGIEVGIGADGRVAAAGAGVATIGYSLSATTAAGQDIDVLIR